MKNNILIVEDNLMNFEIAQELLINAGYNVLYAANASEGIKIAKQKNPDLILMDLSLPEMDGLTATKNNKARSSYQKYTYSCVYCHGNGK